MDSLMKLIGDYEIDGIKVATFILLISAIVYLYKLYKKAKQLIIVKYEEETEKDKKINETYTRMEQYQEDQKKLLGKIERMQEMQEKLSEQLHQIDEKTKKYELANSRDRLLQSYRYYTNRKKNPMQSWTELEKEAFFEVFGNYEDAGGDGFMHTTVQPEMNTLTVIPMHETTEIAELMASRH